MADFSASLCQNPSRSTIETEGSRKKHPPLPPNYVSLRDLKEKRLREQQEQKQREEREQQEQKAREEREREAEAQRKQLELDKSLRGQQTKPSNRPPRTHASYQPKIVEKRGDIPTIIEGETNGQGTINEGSKRRNGWKGETRHKEWKALTVADPARSLLENGGKEEDPKLEMGKSAGGRKVGVGLWSMKEDRTVRIAQENQDLETDRRREADERSTAEKKVRDMGPRGMRRSTVENPSEKTGWKDKEDRTAKVAWEIRDLKGAGSDEMEKTDGGREAERQARKKPKTEMGKPAGGRKIGIGFRSMNEDKTVRIAPEIQDLDTDGPREVDERSTAEKKVRDKGPRGIGRSTVENPSEKTGSNMAEEVAREIRDLKVADSDEMEKTDGGRVAERKAGKKPYRRRKEKKDKNLIVEIAQKKGNAGSEDCDQTVEKTEDGKEADERSKGKKDRNWTVEMAQKKGNAGSADCDQTVEKTEDGGEADVRLTAGNDIDFGSLKEKISGTLVEDVEKDRVDPAAEVDQKIGELKVVDCDEENEKGVGERSMEMAEMKPGYQRWRNERISGYRRGFGYGRGFGNGRGFGYGRSFGNGRGFGYGRSFGNDRGFGYESGFGHRERRQPKHLMWVKKEEDSSSSGGQPI